jgi:ribosomal protein L11 methyltransferase
MAWIQITLTVDRSDAPLVEAALENAGALAVTLSDAGDDPLLEPLPGTMPLWTGVRLTALFPDDPAARATVEGLTLTLGARCPLPPLVEPLDDRPWERVWLDEFRATRFGRRLWVCPQGQGAPERDGVVVDLDPGLAFGTGHHPTTALCLEWLDGAELAGRTLLDYGCGSGILAIAALKLGAAHAIALDHDPQAIEATRANAERNQVADRLFTGGPEALGQIGARLPADLVVANILAGPLVTLAPTLTRQLHSGGDLALSGVLRDQVATVSAAYAGDVNLGPTRIREDWALITGTRR